jgi:hypothetical protein
LPWEVDRSAVADLIEFLKKDLKRQSAARKAVADETIEVTHYYSPYNCATGKQESKMITFTRTTFDEAKMTPNAGLIRGGGFYENKTFDQCKERDLSRRDDQIKRIKADIIEFNKRYDGWKQTHEWSGDKWVTI